VITHRVADPSPRVVLDVWDPSYLDPDFQRDAIRDLHAAEGNPEQRFGVYLLDGLDPRSGLGRAVELERFGEAFANDRDLLRDLYGAYEDVGATELCCVVDHEELRPAGVMRLIRNSVEYGSRTMDDLQADGENGWSLELDELWDRAPLAASTLDEIVDVPTLAVARDYQSGRDVAGISRAICASVFQRVLSTDVETMVCAFERIPAMLVQAFTGDFWNEFDGVPARPYYGAPDTIPMWSNPREYELRIRTTRQDLYDKFVLLEGLAERYHFAWPDGAPQWEPLEAEVDLRDRAEDEEVVDLRQYDPVTNPS